MAEDTNEQTTLNLEQVMEDGLVKFEGELKEAAASDTDIEPTDTKSDEGPAKTETEPEGKKTEDLEETDAPGKIPDTETPPEKRFLTHEKAEAGYRDLQGEKTRVDQELAMMRKENEDLKGAEKQKADQDKADTDFEEFATGAYKNALVEIDALDADDEEYQDKVSGIFARRDKDIRKYETEHGTPKKETTAVDTETPGKEQPGGEGNDEVSDEIKDAISIRDSAAKEAGIDPADEHFLFVCKSTPKVDEQGTPMTYEQQVKWAVDKTTKYHDSRETAFKDRTKAKTDAAALKNQEAELPLGRAGIAPPGETKDKDESKPVSLDDAIESASEERIL